MASVRRALLMALTWAAGTALGVVLGWWGVQLVTFQVVEAQTAPLSQPHVLQALEAVGEGPGEEAVDPATSVIPAPPTAPASSPDPPRVPVTAGGSLPAPLAPGAGGPPAPVALGAAAAPTTTTTTTVPTPTTTTMAPVAVTTSAPTTTTTVAPAPSAAPKEPTKDKATYQTVSAKGGMVAVRYQGGRVWLLWARPNDGFQAEVVQDGPERVEVLFRSHEHRSVIRAYWKDGSPRQEVVEQPRRPAGDSRG